MSKQDNKHTEFLVIDIESTCWGEGQTPPGMLSEIIEIGYSVFDATNNLVKSYGSVLVKPVASTVSEYCTNLTHITQEMVDRGVSFREACEILKNDLNSLGRPWVSFGEYDRTMFTEQCKRMGVEYPFTKQHENAKQLHAIITGKTQGLGAALTSLGLQFQGQQHRGGDDARNIALLLQYYANKHRGFTDRGEHDVEKFYREEIV